MNATEFFYEHAGYCYGQNETPEQGRQRCAEALARAEAWASEHGCSYEWAIDQYSDSTDWSDDVESYPVWGCILHDKVGSPLGSLWGIDFGPDSEPWGEPYRRVVEAELALEAMG